MFAALLHEVTRRKKYRVFVSTKTISRRNGRTFCFTDYIDMRFVHTVGPPSFSRPSPDCYPKSSAFRSLLEFFVEFGHVERTFLTVFCFPDSFSIANFEINTFPESPRSINIEISDQIFVRVRRNRFPRTVPLDEPRRNLNRSSSFKCMYCITYLRNRIEHYSYYL
jgi:hypothetical protein